MTDLLVDSIEENFKARKRDLFLQVKISGIFYTVLLLMRHPKFFRFIKISYHLYECFIF